MATKVGCSTWVAGGLSLIILQFQNFFARAWEVPGLTLIWAICLTSHQNWLLESGDVNWVWSMNNADLNSVANSWVLRWYVCWLLSLYRDGIVGDRLERVHKDKRWRFGFVSLLNDSVLIWYKFFEVLQWHDRYCVSRFTQNTEIQQLNQVSYLLESVCWVYFYLIFAYIKLWFE